MREQDILNALPSLSNPQLRTIAETVEQLLSERTANDKTFNPYVRLKTRIMSLAVYNQQPRYTQIQIDTVLKPWNALSEAARKQFISGWNKAIKDLVRLGFSNDQRLIEFTVMMLAESPFFDDKFQFKSIIESLNNVTGLLDHHFPGYIANGGLEVLIDQFQGDNERKEP